MGELDGIADLFRELTAGPGSDTRQWVAYGQVCPESGGTKSTRFNDPSGAPLPHGVLVDVKLQPSGNIVPCRVSSMCAGNGEGEHYPFVGGDEVLVVIPEGDERAGCCIVGRLNQSHDVFPTTVAGMDVTQNNFGFRRHVAPYVVECGSGYMIRQATTGSGLSFDQQGQIFLTEGGTGAQLVLTPDVLGLFTKDFTAGLQVDVANTIAHLKAGKASLTIADGTGAQGTQSMLQTSGTFSVSTSGNPGLNHVATVEGVTQLLTGFCTVMATAFATLSGPVVGAELAALFAPGPSAALINGALALAMTPACSFAPYIAAIKAALSVPKVPGANASVGAAGFLTE